MPKRPNSPMYPSSSSCWQSSAAADSLIFWKMSTVGLTSDPISVDMAFVDDEDAISTTPLMKEFLENGIFETKLYLNAIDGFVRLSKPDLIALFVKNISIPSASEKLLIKPKLSRNLDLNLVKYSWLNSLLIDTYKLANRNKLELMVSDIHELSNFYVNNQLDSNVMKIFELKNKNAISNQNGNLSQPAGSQNDTHNYLVEKVNRSEILLSQALANIAALTTTVTSLKSCIEVLSSDKKRVTSFLIILMKI